MKVNPDYEAHSRLLNQVSWRLSETLGDVPQGADAIEGDDALILVDRLTSQLVALRALAEAAEELNVITQADGRANEEADAWDVLATAIGAWRALEGTKEPEAQA